MHPTLLIGPADWQPEQMPVAEFSRRIEALWHDCPGTTRALVCGDSRHHAELAYLTNFGPKLEPAVALLTRGGAPRLFVGGGPNMLDAARPLTWIADLAPMRELERVGHLSDCVLIGADCLTTAAHTTVTKAAGGSAASDATAVVTDLMRRKSPAELSAVGSACATLRGAVAAAAETQRLGGSVTEVVLAGERAANAQGAQDVRSLFSVNGGRTLLPFERLDPRPIEPLQLYFAVRRFNYWAEGFVVLTRERRAVVAQAAAILQSAIIAAVAGTLIHDLARVITGGAFPYGIHPVVADSIGQIGIALDAPCTASAALATGEVYSLRVGFTDGADENAIVSAMIAVQEEGCDVLWVAD